MKTIEKLWSVVLGIMLMLCMGFGLAGCEYQWEIEGRKVFETADQITKNPDYALINDFEYRSAEEAIVWKELIEEKIKSDRKKIESTSYCTALYLKEPNTTKGGFVAFTYKYGENDSWAGCNKNTQKYAIGTISLDDYSFKIHYLNFPYSKLYISQISETHFCCTAEDDDTTVYVSVNRENGKIEKQFDNFDAIKESFTGALTQIYNERFYTENEIVYTIARRSEEGILRNKEEKIELYTPSYEYVMEKSEELRAINEIAKADNYKVKARFISNGTELFVVFSKGTNTFGMECQLVPVVFRCDTSFETFEYIGCMYNAQTYYPERLSIIKLNG